MDNCTGLFQLRNEVVTNGKPDTFQLGNEEKTKFENVIDKAWSPPLLALTNANLPYSLKCDVSDYGIGFALFQINRMQN